MEQIQEGLAKTAAAEAVRLMGGPVATARTLGVEKYQTVQSWVRNGIPPRYCLRISSMTGIGVERLRPTDWADYWPTAQALTDEH